MMISNSLASATYVIGNDYEHSMAYSLEDGNRKSAAVISNFKDSYNIKVVQKERNTFIRKDMAIKPLLFFNQKLNVMTYALCTMIDFD